MVTQPQLPTDALFAAAAGLTYPEHLMVPVPQMIDGLAFFPGGHGLFQTGTELPPFPFGGVMVIGQDFDTKKNFEHSKNEKGESLRGATWRQLLSMLDNAAISRTDCFYTNAYMGLRAGDDPKISNTGPSPGRRCAAFRQACASFLVTQIERMRPRVVVCLGNEVLSFVSQVADVPTSWQKPSWPRIDAAAEGLLFDVPLTESDFVVPAVAAVVHPSFRHANARVRRFRGLAGQAAEVELLRVAMATTQALAQAPAS